MPLCTVFLIKIFLGTTVPFEPYPHGTTEYLLTLLTQGLEH